MKKLLILLAVLTSVVNIQSAISDNVDIYGKFNLGIWYMSPVRCYDDTVPGVKDTVINDQGDTIINDVWGFKDTMDNIISNWIPFGTFGVKYKGDRFGGCIEMGTHLNMYELQFYGQVTEDFHKYDKKITDYVTMKKWYVEWYVNDILTFLLGKAGAPTNFGPSNQIFWGGYGFNNIGCLSTGAYPMLQLTIQSPNEKLKGKIAIIKPDTSVIEIANAGSADDIYECDARLPKFEGSFGYSIEKGIFSTYGNFAGGYQQFNVVYSKYLNENINYKAHLKIPSFAVGADLGVKIGPVSVAVDGYLGKNVGIYGAFVGDEFGWWRSMDYMSVFFPISPEEDELLNGTTMQLAGIVTIKPKDFLAFEGGIGMVTGEHEDKNLSSRFHNTLAWYFQTDITFLEMLKVTPEVGQYDYGPRMGFGKYFYWGINLGVDF